MIKSPLLAIDASTYTGTVAVISEGQIVSQGEVAMRGRDEERLMPAVAEALAVAGLSTGDLGSVVCGDGPGSFTSLRIAASIGKGIASGFSIPLYSASSLLLMVAGSQWSGVAGKYLAVLNAMRGELFAACYEVTDAGTIQEVTPLALVEESFVQTRALELDARIMGIGRQLDAFPHARGVAICERSASGLSRVDLGGWEPGYGRLVEAQVKWESTHARPLYGR